MAEGGGAGTTGDEKIVAKVMPGYYLAHIKFFLADADTYKGLAVLSDFPAAAPTAGAPSEPAGDQPASQPQQPAAPSEPHNADRPAAKKKAKQAACKKKAKKIENKKKRKKALKRCAKVKG